MEIIKQFTIFLVLFTIITGASSAGQEANDANLGKKDQRQLETLDQIKLNSKDSTEPTISRVKRHFGYGYNPYYYGYYPRPYPLPVPILIGGGFGFGGFGGFGGHGFGVRGFGGRGFGGFGGRGIGGFGHGRG